MKATEAVKHTKEQAEASRVTASTNQTNPRALENKPRTHLRNTRANTTGHTPSVATTEQTRRRSRRLNPEEVLVHSTEPNSALIQVF